MPRFNRRRAGLAAGMIGLACVLLAPAPEGMGPEAQKTAAVAVLMVCWWVSEAVHIGVTGFVPIVLLPLLGVSSSSQVAAQYANPLIFLFIGGFIIAYAMEAWNLHRRIALATISRFGSRPRRLVLGFMIATAALSMWISNTATTMMLLPVAMAVVSQLSESAQVQGVSDPSEAEVVARKSFGCILLLGIAYAASIGGVGTIVGSPTNVAFVGYAAANLPDQPPIGFVQWSMVCLPIVVVFLPLAWLYLCRFSGSTPLSRIRFASSQDVIREELAALGPITTPEKRVLFAASTTALLWVTRAPIELGTFSLPGWSQLFPDPSAIHDSVVAMGMAVLLFLLPSGQASEGKGSRLLTWSAAARGIPWGIVFLIGGGLALAADIARSGLAAWLGSWLAALEGVPGWVLVLAICLTTTVITETASNVAAVLMLSPAVAAMAAEVGVHPYLLLLPMAVTSSFAFTMPVATPPNAIIFSSGWIKIPQMFRAGVVLDVIGLAVVPAGIYLIGAAAFGFA